ncbi:hypothetical protein LXL04_022748 [Taraxacum kok-saghyz]
MHSRAIGWLHFGVHMCVILIQHSYPLLALFFHLINTNIMSSSANKKFAHLQIPLEEIQSATRNFSKQNFIKKAVIGNVYRGQLSRSGQKIDILAQRIDCSSGFGDIELWREILTLSRLGSHRNLSSVIGFFNEKNEKIIIRKQEANGSLDQCLADPTLTWMRRLRICVGVAQALSYMYYQKGRDFSVIHCDITSSKILLDDQWQPKLSGFEFSLTQTIDRRNDPCLTDIWGFSTCDPVCAEERSVSHKSEVYSLGVVLMEVMYGKKAIDEEYRLLAPSAISDYDRGILSEKIHQGLREQMAPKSFKIFSETAYYCLKEKRSERPNIQLVLIKLKEALEYQWKHENPVRPSSMLELASIQNGVGSDHYMMLIKNEATTLFDLRKKLQGNKLQHLEIPLSDIMSATENFAEKYIIGSGSYGKVYKAKLHHFDSKASLPIEQKKNKGELQLPKKCSTVAIKSIFNTEDKQGEKGFYAEIEMLGNCKHPNIVTLLGFCEEDGHMILVYEYASNGSLDNYLGNTANLSNLTWVERIKICIGIARGLSYLHNMIEDERRIIHRDIKSGNILLDENWEVKIADFGLSKFRHEDRKVNTLYTQTIAGTEVYWDPEYYKLGKLNNKSDIYSFGVVLFEMLSGRIANDPIYTNEDSNGIAPVARRHFNEGTIKKMLDPRLMEKAHERFFTLNKGPDQDSLVAFSEIAHKCVAETQAGRPSAEVVIQKLEEALSFQENPKDNLKVSLDEIKSATKNFSDDNLIGRGGYGVVYKGEITQANGCITTVAVKRLNEGVSLEKYQPLMELEFLKKYKHKNIIGLIGYCTDSGENIIVYEYASKGGLYKHLNNNALIWTKRLEICHNIASGLQFLHGGAVTKEVLIHRNINTSSILLTHDWKAKITEFGDSLISPISNDFVVAVCETQSSYFDPVYVESGIVSKESDIYSFGIVLFGILCGKEVKDHYVYDYHASLLVKVEFNEGKLDEMVFDGIEAQIAPKSLATFRSIASRCIHEKREDRPTIREVLLELEIAMGLQEDFDIWKHKLPKDYKEIIPARILESTRREKDIYNMLSKGVLQEHKLLLTLGGNGTQNEMISAKTFSYINRSLHRWRSIPESSFPTVVEMLDVANLNIKIRTRPQHLSPNVVYGVYMVFKFCDPRKVSSKPLYVNLKYKSHNGKTSHAYFATWRDNKWMMIELCQFSNHKKDIVFEFLLEGFSRYYCGDSTIYVEGLEFRAIENASFKNTISFHSRFFAKHDQIEGLENVQQVIKREEMFEKSDCGEKVRFCYKKKFISRTKKKRRGFFIWLSEMNGKKTIMVSAKGAVYNYSDVTLFKTKPSAQSRFQEVIEVLSSQVLRINCKIESQMISQDTDYVCYLVFKLSEKCRGLHCPIRVRDLIRKNNKEGEYFYFRPPTPWNLHDNIRAPAARADGWMEVNLWSININRQPINDIFRLNLKLISYEGTMSGLIICGLEFRPM